MKINRRIRWAVALLLVAGAGWAEAETIIPAAPAVLEYEGTAGSAQTTYIFRIWSTQPDFKVEWEEGFRMGGFLVPGAEGEQGRTFYRKYGLKNGRDVTLRGTCLFLSRDCFAELKTGAKVVLRINDVPVWLRRTGETEWDFQGLKIPVVQAEDSSGARYLFQDDPAFPLCVRFENKYYTEVLTKYYAGEDIIFRWFKKR